MSTTPSTSFRDAMPGMRIARPDGSQAMRANEQAKGFYEAMRLMEAGRFEAAFVRLARLADSGHPQAARIALLFVKRGTSLFGGTFQASTKQRGDWQLASD
jgi:hypothetical protein